MASGTKPLKRLIRFTDMNSSVALNGIAREPLLALITEIGFSNRLRSVMVLIRLGLRY